MPEQAAAIRPGELARLAPSIHRITAFNAGMMTGPGTNTWILGRDELAVLDPGPASPEHIGNVLAKAPGRVRWVLATHTHADHSPGAVLLAKRANAEVIGLPPPPGRRQDQTFSPAVQPGDGQEFDLAGFRAQAIHTPGHASNHVCWWHAPAGVLFTGDHVMQGSTVVIAPPDGDMSAYMASLRRVLRLPLCAVAPGHGHWIRHPRREIESLIEHRKGRERKVAAVLDALGAASKEDMLARVYDDVPARLHSVAALSLEAHLVKLERDGRAIRDGELWRLAGGPA